MKVPALECRVDPYDDLGWAWKAFADLHRTREDRETPIRTTEIEAWLGIHGFEGDEAIEIHDLVLEMDQFWLRWWSEKRAAAEAESVKEAESKVKRR